MRTKKSKTNGVNLLNSNQLADATNSLINSDEDLDNELIEEDVIDDELNDLESDLDESDENEEEFKHQVKESKKEEKTIENDQGYLIDAIATGEYDFVWEVVKHIGIDKVRNINQRMSKFYQIVKEFDYKRNNNFIHFYKQRLGWYDDFFNNSTFIVTRTRQVMKELIIEGISPSEDVSKTLIVKHLINWQ